jgi:hypothetical protein
VRLSLAALSVLIAGCDRGCRETAPAEPHPSSPPMVAPTALPMMLSPRCEREIARAAVAVSPGAGPVDSVAAACHNGELALFVLRAHTLSRVVRSTQPGASYGSVLVISTGVDQLGPVGHHNVDGPLAWRSPMTGIEEHERDDIWSARIERTNAETNTVLRGDTLMPAGIVGFGLVVPQTLRDREMTVLASEAHEGSLPATLGVHVVLGREQPSEAHDLPSIFSGELKAWEADRSVALSRIDGSTASALEVTWTENNAHARADLSMRYALVAARGASIDGRSAFLVGEFELGGDSGSCMSMGDGMCVRAGPLYLLFAGAPGQPLERLDVAPSGLPDSLAARDHELMVLYVSHNGSYEPQQHAARIDIRHREVTPLVLTPPEGFGAIDGPTLVRCDNDIWIATEVTLPGDAGSSTAVTALPLECIAR